MTQVVDIAGELTKLKNMSAQQLRGRYAELFGEVSRSGNRQWLLRRCAWRVQMLLEGGLSERARRRARELARDQDLRVIPPKGMVMAAGPRRADVVRSAGEVIRRGHDSRLPMPGGQVKRVYKGHLYVVNVLEGALA